MRSFRRVQRSRDEGGSALVLALVVSVAVASLGLSLVAISTLERAAAANFVAGEEALFAAESLVEHALAEISDEAVWDSVLDGSRPSGFQGVGLPVPVTFNATQETTDLQVLSAQMWNIGADTPQWRIYAEGPFGRLIDDGLPAPPVYMAAWVADDPDDGDGDPVRDHNDRLMLRVRACGAGGVCRALLLTLARGAAAVTADEGLSAGVVRGLSGAVRILSWREER